MVNGKENPVYPVEIAGSLDSRIRGLFNPKKILNPYVKEGMVAMVALGIGCGPGFFTIPIAYRSKVGVKGRVIAAGLQEEMLERVRAIIKDTDLEQRIVLHKCDGLTRSFLDNSLIISY